MNTIYISAILIHGDIHDLKSTNIIGITDLTNEYGITNARKCGSLFFTAYSNIDNGVFFVIF